MRIRPKSLLLSLLATAAVALGLSTPAAAATVAPCTIVGTPEDDVLIGTDGDDVICGLGGADLLVGGAGDDVLRGGPGHDTLEGGPGNDELRGGDHGDLLLGGTGNDELWGGNGHDVVRGGSGDDVVYGGPGTDEVRGGDGNDRLRGGTGVDACFDSFVRTHTLTCELGLGAQEPPVDSTPDEDELIDDAPQDIEPESDLGEAQAETDAEGVPDPEDAAPEAPAETVPPVIVDVRGIFVAQEIAEDLERLLDAAAEDGLNLHGGGFRDPQRQIELRKANCGETDYDIWDKPAAECSPPTARPGRSQHELGLAIDFTNDGRLISVQSDPAFVWLATNAPAFGFFNLPVEPWHWSTTGN